MTDTDPRAPADSAAAPPPAITLCYNGFCPLCRGEVEHYQRLAAPRGLPIGWQDVNTSPELFARYGIDYDTALRRVHAIDAEGKLLRGVDAFFPVWRSLPGYRWLAAVLSFPLVRPLAWFGYEYLLALPVYLWNKRRLRRLARAGVPKAAS